MRRMALGEDCRADGRRCDEVRPITSRAGLLPSTHGSSLFTRGETQTIAVVTLGADPLAQALTGGAKSEDALSLPLALTFPRHPLLCCL